MLHKLYMADDLNTKLFFKILISCVFISPSSSLENEMFKMYFICKLIILNAICILMLYSSLILIFGLCLFISNIKSGNLSKLIF